MVRPIPSRLSRTLPRSQRSCRARGCWLTSGPELFMLGGPDFPGAEMSDPTAPATVIDLAEARRDRLHDIHEARLLEVRKAFEDRKSTRLNSSHVRISYAVFCLKKKKKKYTTTKLTNQDVQ